MSGFDLAPGLLLAAPSLHDPNFERTVVLLGRHDGEGALGWVLNGKELGPVGELLRASELFPAGTKTPTDGAFARAAWVGGPVASASGWLLYRHGDIALPGEMAVGELAVTGDVDAFGALLASPSQIDFRMVLGCAGWGPGQLEGEIGAGAWLPATVEADLLFDVDPSALWDEAYKRAVGVGPAAFSSQRGRA